MRFSRLVQLVQVCQTVREAAEYNQKLEHPSINQDLLQNGKKMLEEMKEFLYQYQSDWINNNPIGLLDQIRSSWQFPFPPTITEQLEGLSASLKVDVKIQVRAVFFAELGGKWDSMESVYQYMRNDPRFDPVVVLTPIFRAKQINGKTETEVIYEDYLSKMGIPFLNYWEYDPEQDCPELAFISQPYEIATLPEFWAENISKYTRLVYLPYFIPHMMYSDSREVLCNMPIHTYAWRIAGSSQRFADYFSRYSQRHGENMMVTGIPKMDYVINLKNNPCPIPQVWRQKIEGRTTILWNTWFDGNASSLDLLDQMLPWFSAHQEYALIWRPHPMSEAIMKLYQPEQYLKLEKMMDTVRSTNNMVLDTDAEYGPSFVCSHAQISDFSSMMTQYLLMDKPLLWIDIPGKTLAVKESEEQMVSNHWMEKGANIEDIIAFLQRIRRGEDRNRTLRTEVRAQYLPLADGKAAERICERLWKDLSLECL